MYGGLSVSKFRVREHDDDMPRTAYVGRERLLAEVRRFVGDAAAGQGRLVLVTGEPGIGKTSFASEAARDARDAGMELLWATCWDGTGAPVYWPWVQILRAHAAAHGALSSEVAQIMPGLAAADHPGSGSFRSLRPSDGAAERFALFDSVASLLLRSAHTQPLMIVIDDLQWADISSLLLLKFLSGQLNASAVIVVGLYRDTEIGPNRSGSEELIGLRHHAELISLGGLNKAEIARLAADISDTHPSPGQVTEIHRRTAGNPFFVREVVALLSRGAAGEGRGGPIPDGVGQVVRQRLARLPQACVSLLAVAAAAGQESSLDLLAQATQLPVPVVMDHLEQAVRAQVIAPPGQAAGPYRFAHDLFREAVYDGLVPRVRAELHLRLAEALERPAMAHSASHSAELSAHFLRAAIGHPDRRDLTEKAVRYGRSAGHEASARLAYEDAVGQFGRILDGLGPAGLLSARPRADLLVDRGDALRRQGALVRAGKDYAAAGDWARRAGDAEVLGRAALGVHGIGVESGRSREGCIAVLAEALDSLAEEKTALRAQVLAALARELSLGEAVQRPRAAELSGLAVDIARRVGDDVTLAGCLLASHDAAWVPGMAALRQAIATEMAVVARRAGDRAFEAEAALLRASAGLELGDPQALRDLDEFDRLGAAVKQPHFDYLVVTRQAMRAIMTGHFDEADELLASAAKLAETLDEPDAWNVETNQLWIMRTLQGRRAEIETRLRSCTIPQLKYWFDGLVALSLLERADRPAAVQLMRSALAAYPTRLPMSYVIAAQWADLGEVAVALGGPTDIEHYYAALRPHAGDAVMIAAAVGFGGAVDHHLGILSTALGRVDEAIDHLERAVEFHERMLAWPWLARSRCALASVLASRGRLGDQERVERLTVEVREAAQELGLVGLLRRLDEIAHPHENVFCRDGESWRIGFAGTEIRLREVKGLADLAALIKARGQEVPATTLTGAAVITGAGPGSDPVLDRRAQQAYRQRLVELDRGLDEADREDDRDRSERLATEQAFLVRELSSAVGLRGRDRSLGDDRERARKAVAARIKDAVQRIEHAHPALGAHLRQSVTTGTFCSYRPARPVSWRC